MSMQITKSAGVRKNITSIALAAVALLPLAALSCRSGPAHPAGREVQARAPEPLVGSAALLDGAIEVNAAVAMGGVPGPGGAGGRRPPGPGSTAPGPGAPMGGPPRGMAGGGAGRGGGMGGGGPSHALTVMFTNTGAETLEVTIIEVKSRLGNFLPQPDTLALAPGQTGALYPMRGSLPDDVAALELTVSIRTKDGRTDTCVVVLSGAAAPHAGGGP